MTVANTTKHRYVQPHDETKVETRALLMLKRVTTLLHQVGHLHQPLDAGVRGMMTQQRGKARKGGRFLYC